MGLLRPQVLVTFWYAEPFLKMAEGRGFEPLWFLHPSAFETAAISLSANLPYSYPYILRARGRSKLVVPVGAAPTTSTMSM